MGLYMIIALVVTVIHIPGVFGCDSNTQMFRRTPQPDLPANYTDMADILISDCEGPNQCTLACQKREKQYCEATVYNKVDQTCLLYKSAIANVSSAPEPNNLTYYEGLCALNSPDRPESCPPIASAGLKDCQEYHERGFREPGTYHLRIISKRCKKAACYFDSNNGWAIIQRRVYGNTSFDQRGSKYEHGFGDVKGDYWLGTYYIYMLNWKGNSRLSIVMQSWNGAEATANYTSFKLEYSQKYYYLKISGYSGDAGDAMAHHNGLPFTTKDTYDDDGACARDYESGWWFDVDEDTDCFQCNLNGVYAHGENATNYNAVWGGGSFDHTTGLKYITMAVTRD